MTLPDILERGFLSYSLIFVKLTTRGRYSVKALLDLSLQPGYGPASVQSIAQRQALPAPYLEKLLIAMRQAGLVVSVRGAQGGYRLAKKPGQIFVGDILAAVGESITEEITDLLEPVKPLKLPNITVSTNESILKEPAIAADWVMMSLWQRLQTKMQAAVDDISLADLYYDARSWQASQGEENNYTV
jgi:Rrf2 family transcriptional regulator, iron-sulfur cluster assembly transcription factor